MNYITPEEYKQLSGLDHPDNIGVLIIQASAMIDTLTMYRIKDFDLLPEWMQHKVKLATTEQVTYLDDNGGPDGLCGLSSAGLGKFSYSKGTVDNNRYTTLVTDYLLPTGLLYRGIDVV